MQNYYKYDVLCRGMIMKFKTPIGSAEGHFKPVIIDVFHDVSGFFFVLF